MFAIDFVLCLVDHILEYIAEEEDRPFQTIEWKSPHHWTMVSLLLHSLSSVVEHVEE